MLVWRWEWDSSVIHVSASFHFCILFFLFDFLFIPCVVVLLLLLLVLLSSDCIRFLNLIGFMQEVLIFWSGENFIDKLSAGPVPPAPSAPPAGHIQSARLKESWESSIWARVDSLQMQNSLTQFFVSSPQCKNKKENEKSIRNKRKCCT